MTNLKIPFWKLFFIAFFSIFSVNSYSQKCIDLGVGIGLSNGENAFIDFMKNGNRWEVEGPDGHPWYKVYSMDEFKIINGAYWTWDIDWSGTINNEAWGDNWADTYHDYYQMSIEQGAFDEQGWPKQVPYTLYKYFPKSTDPDQGIDMTQPIPINNITRRYYFPDGLPQDGWVLKWEGTGAFSWQGLEITTVDQGTAVEGGNSWTTDGSYAGRNVNFTSTGSGRIICKHHYMVHGWVLDITSSDVNDPIRNIEFIYPGLEANHDAGETFHPQFIERMKQFKVLRYMGYLASNGIEKRKIMSSSHPFNDSHMLKYMDWSERTPGDWYRVSDGSGGAYEYIIELANLTKTDPWVNIPYCAGPEYADSITRFFLERLDPDLTLYFEVGNELWNFGSGFSGFHWVARNKVLRYPGLGDVESRGAHINVIYDRVTDVAGSKGLERIQRVYGAFPRYTDVNNRTLNYIDADNWDCLATTWYFGLEQNDPANMDCIDDVSGENWRKVLYDWHIANPGDQAGFNAKYKECVLNEFRCGGGYRDNSDVVLSNYYGKYVVCYEGGNHTFYGCTNAPYSRIALEDYDGSPDELNFDADANFPTYITDNSFINAAAVADESQEMADVYNEIIDSLQSAGVRVANHLSFAGRSSCYGIWSFLQPKDMEEDLATLFATYPKFKLYSDRIAADNCNAVYVDLDTNLVGPGLSVMMDGLNDYVEGPSTGIPNESSDYTMETWFKIRHLDIEQVVMELINDGANNNYNVVKARLDQKIVWEIGNNTSVYAKMVGPDLLEDKWYHIALTKSGNRYTMYLNGRNVASGNYTVPVSARNHFCIGASYSPPFGASNLGGEIDEVKMWSTALTENDIREYMCKKVTPSHTNYANLVTYYRFDRPDKVNFEVYDIKTGVNSGQLYNINFTSRSRYAISSAPIGDYSKFVYTFDWAGIGLTLNHPQGDMLAVANIGGGGAYGVHAYIVDDESYYNDIPQYYEGISNNRYFGVYVTGGDEISYDVNYIYQGNPQIYSGADENKHRLLKREHSADEFWIHSGAKIDMIANALSISCKEKDRGEYTLAFRNSTNILRPGPGMALHQTSDPSGSDGGRLQYLALNDYTVTFWSKGQGEVFNLTGKLGQGEERFSVSGNASAGFRYSPPDGPGAQGFDFGTSPRCGTVDEWIHWAVVRDGTKVTVYANGRLAVEKDFIGQRFREELFILQAPSYVSVCDISIDEFSLWDVPLTQEEIRDWMCKKVNETHPQECEHLVLYFNFDEGQGTVLEDRRGRSDMVLQPINTFEVSGAYLGDESAHEYTNPDNFSFAHPDGDYIEVTKTSSEPVYGVQLYRVEEPPIPSDASSGTILSMDSSRYWGMYVVDAYNITAEYNVVMHYDGNTMIIPGNEDELRLMERVNAEASQWTANEGILPNLGNSTLTLNSQHAGEYILGGTTTNTFIGDCTPAQPAFVAEAGLVNMSAVCGNATGLMFVVVDDPLVESYIWTLPNGLSGFSTSDTMIVNAELGYESPPDFTISVIGANRCGESVPATYNVTINPPPTLADAGPDQLILPPSTTATMDGNSVIGGETGTWSIGLIGTGTITTASDPLTTITALGSGTNYFVWTIDNGLCQPSIDTVTIIVAPPPQNVINANGDPMPQRICEGEIITLKAIPAEDIVPDGYQWTLPDGLSEISSLGDEITILVGTGFGGSIEVSSVYAGSPSAPYISPVMGINPQPNKPVFVNDYSTICYMIDIDLQAAYDASIDSFVWTFPTYLVPTTYPKSTLETIEVQALDTITGFIKVQAFNNGCTNSDAKDSVYFEVQMAPDRPLLYLGTDGGTADPFCNNDPGLLWVKNVDTASVYEWRWDSDVEIIQYFHDNRSAALFQMPGSNSSIWVKAIKGTGACNTSEEFNFNGWQWDQDPETITGITISDPPATDPMDLQIGQIYTIDVTGTATNYYWNMPDGVTIVDNVNNNSDASNQIIVNEAFAGYLEIFPITLRGCSGTSDRIAIGTAGVLMPPDFISGNLTLCQGTSLIINVSDVGATEYVWTLPDGTEVITATPVFNQIINTPQAGDMSVYARTGGNQSTSIVFYVEVEAIAFSTGDFIDVDGNPLTTLDICTSFSHEPVYYQNVGQGQIIWRIEGGAIQFEPRWQPGEPTTQEYELRNRWTVQDTMIPISYVSWRETNSGPDGYIKIDLINNCGGSDLKDSIYYNVVQTITSQVPNFTDMPTSVCVGSSVTYRLDPIENAEQYIWGLPSGLEAVSVVTTVPEITVDVFNGLGGQITVYAMGSACGGGQTMTQTSDVITIAGTPSGFDFIEAPLAGCPGDNLTYTVNDAGVPDYTWSIPYGLSPDVPGKTIIVDNDDPECTIAGPWNVEIDAAYVNGSFLRQGNCSGTCDDGANDYDTYVLYTPVIPTAGKYRVTLSYPPYINSNETLRFYVDVIDVNGTTQTQLQYSNSTTPLPSPVFADLGIYDFEIGTAGYVRVNTIGSHGYRAIGTDHVMFELVEEFILPSPDTSVTFEVTGGGISSLCVTIADPMCSSGYTICTDPINLGGNMDIPVFEAQEVALCIGSSYEFQVSNIGADTYTWMLPPGLSIGGSTGEVSGLSGTETIDVVSDPGSAVDISVFGVINSCSVISDTVTSLSLTISNCNLLDPQFVSEPTPVCTGTLALFSILPVIDAEMYEWQLPTGIEENGTGSTGTVVTLVPNITVIATTNGTLGAISVRATAPVAGITSSNWVPTTLPIEAISQPSFTVSVSGVSSCIVNDGAITLSGLLPLTEYQVSYNDGILQGPNPLTTDGVGDLEITGLAAATIIDIDVSLGACSTTDNGPYTIQSASNASISSATFISPALCGQTGSVEITLSNATEDDSYAVDLNNDGSYEDTVIVVGGELNVTGIITDMSISGILIFNTASSCSDISTSIGTISMPVTAQIDTIIFNQPAICGGTGSIAIEVSNATEGQAYNIDIDNDGFVDYTSTVSGGVIGIPSLSAGVIVSELVITNQTNLCTSTSSITGSLFDPTPVSIDSLSFTHPTTCDGTGSIVINLAGATNGDSYDVDYDGDDAIDYPGGIVSSGAITMSGLSAGVGISALVITNTGDNCKTTSLEADTLENPPLPDVNLALFNPVCEGEASFVLFGGTPLLGTYSGTYVNAGSFDPVIAGVGTHTITYEYTDSLNCTNSASETIDVYALPAGTLTADPGNRVCIGEEITFTATGGTDYTFMINSVPIQISINDYYSSSSFNNNDTMSVSVMENGCTSVYPSIVITIDSLPTGGTLVSSNATSSICSEEPITFTASGGNTYDFMINGNVFLTNYSGIYISGSEILMNDTISVAIIDANNCRSVVDSQFVIFVSDNPVIGSIEGDNPVCPGATDMLYELPLVYFNNDYTYVWEVTGEDNMTIESKLRISVDWLEFEDDGIVSVIVTDTNSECYTKDSMIVSIVDSDIPTISCYFDDAKYPYPVTAEIGDGSIFYEIKSNDKLLIPSEIFDECQKYGYDLRFTVNNGTENDSSSFVGYILENTTDFVFTWIIIDKAGHEESCETFINMKVDDMPPSAFSPNGDGNNDTWEIEFLQLYPNCIVKVFDRRGKLVKNSAKGYVGDEWDGTLEGRILPVDSYHYVIYYNVGDDKPSKKGTVTIIR